MAKRASDNRLSTLDDRAFGLRLIGDSHSNWATYLDYVRSAPGVTLHMGDLASDGYVPLESVDSVLNKIIPGNHDTYSEIPNFPHFLPDYGSFRVFSDIGEELGFYIRGAWSRNRNRKSGCYDKEEIAPSSHDEIVELYGDIKPQYLFSHDCPQSVVNLQHGEKSFTTSTSELLERLLEVHSPKVWWFAHHHHEFTVTHRDTEFICVPRDKFIDVPFIVSFA